MGGGTRQNFYGIENLFRLLVESEFKRQELHFWRGTKI